MRIGVSNDNYPEKRTIIVDSGVEYVNYKNKNLYYYLNLFNQKVLKKRKNFLFKPVIQLRQPDVDIFHLFNEVALTDRKWVATFETELPRILPPPSGNKSENISELKKLFPALAAGNCVALIALSGAAYRMEQKLFRCSPEVSDAILNKMVVVHPPQKLYVQQREPRANAQPVHFVFVGNEFYRKGGGEVVRAFEQLLTEGKIQPDQVKVTLIGDLEKRHNYALGKHQDDPQFSTATEAAIAGHSIFDHVKFMPNEQVLSLLQKADVGLLPTWAETYGFSVLEMQSCGCPVITTNVRALPEINPLEAGWQISHELNDDLEYSVLSGLDRDKLRQQTVKQLKELILDIVSQPEQITLKANAAIERIRIEHDVEAYQAKLRTLYNQ
ncbi:glycosyltransferase family 4 protein [Pantoea sp. BAV 3049]|uniref:glycosyltransferase family 4 protein n=1 Tax=Pantoea sp. BAV 3049 TaxID=2654188 RepID=UPI00131B5E96|nr:glycosyltransferase [Pantoea sp. BAV 3049]